MMASDDDGWSLVAADWSELWGAFSDPARHRVIEAAGIGAGTRVLDAGCGSGEFPAMLGTLGAVASGFDPAGGMVRLARAASPAADIRTADFDPIPWPDASFDVVTALNALQFAEDTLDAVAECVRVLVPGGRLAIVNWAEGALNDLDILEAAVADGDEREPDGDLRLAGGLEELIAEAGLELVASGTVEVPWTVADGDALVRGVLLGEDRDVMDAAAPVVLAAASRFRTATGGYRLVNTFRYVVARTGG